MYQPLPHHKDTNCGMLGVKIDNKQNPPPQADHDVPVAFSSNYTYATGN